MMFSSSFIYEMWDNPPNNDIGLSSDFWNIGGTIPGGGGTIIYFDSGLNTAGMLFI